MSFWKNPEYKVLRMVLVLVVLVAIAYFAMNAKKSNSLDQSGKVIETNMYGTDGNKEELSGFCDEGVSYSGDSCTVTKKTVFGCRRKEGTSSEHLNLATGEVSNCCQLERGSCVLGFDQDGNEINISSGQEYKFDSETSGTVDTSTAPPTPIKTPSAK
jgi:uncharacterized protein (UPF0333 family)